MELKLLLMLMKLMRIYFRTSLLQTPLLAVYFIPYNTLPFSYIFLLISI